MLCDVRRRCVFPLSFGRLLFWEMFQSASERNLNLALTLQGRALRGNGRRWRRRWWQDVKLRRVLALQAGMRRSTTRYVTLPFSEFLLCPFASCSYHLTAWNRNPTIGEQTHKKSTFARCESSILNTVKTEPKQNVCLGD